MLINTMRCLIYVVYFSIGLDNEYLFLYIKVMKKLIYSQKSRNEMSKTSNKKELISFVADQFKKLAKKNLKIPIQLYHL